MKAEARSHWLLAGGGTSFSGVGAVGASLCVKQGSEWEKR